MRNWDAEGEFFVAEGDESDGTLAFYHPEHAIVLNIEEEHLDYYENLAAIEVVFNQLLGQTRGTRFLLRRRRRTRRASAAVHPGAISYGEHRAPHIYRFDDMHAKDFQSHFRVLRGGEALGAITLNVPGRHNVSNAAQRPSRWPRNSACPSQKSPRPWRHFAARGGASRSNIAASAT